MADATAFHDLSAFVALPRLAGLALSPDGTRLITSVQELSADGTRYVSALWEVDPAGDAEPRRLTRSERGEKAPAFLPDGSLLFLSAREVPDRAEDDKDREESALWRLPASGEAERLLARPGGIADYAVARDAHRVAFAASLLPTAGDAEEDARLREAREKAKVAAILHEASLVRYWDSDLGPAIPHVFVSGGSGGSGGSGDSSGGTEQVNAGARGQVAEGIALSPDGTRVAYTAFIGRLPDECRFAVVLADAATGKQLRVLQSPDHEFSAPVFTPDGRALVCLRETRPTWEAPGNATLWQIPVDPEDHEEPEDRAGDTDAPGGHDLLPGFDQWPVAPVVSRGGDVFFTADERGHCPVFRLSTDGVLTRLTAAGAYGDVVVSEDGGTVYAVHSTIGTAPVPVRLSAYRADQEPVVLKAPGGVGQVPGTVHEVGATADDGGSLRGWLALPSDASAGSRAPLLIFVHGGPQTSWNTWHWRWNPWAAVARGYAVLMPDPALSTGYGQRHHERGWQGWGQQPYRDVIALTDAAAARPDVDGERMALLGGSYGGYMANWVASRTDRFRAIVSHAGLWNLEGFAGDTDHPGYFTRIFGDPLKRTERYEANSPHLHAERITTPMLVIHGAKDYRVPVGEAMALWHQLQRFDVPAKYLYFPDENHWILKPNNARLWYSTVLNFLDHHVLGKEWQRPELL